MKSISSKTKKSNTFNHLYNKAFCLILLSVPFLASSTIASSTSIVDSPKEIIDQVWQMIYRDYLDSNGNYSKEKWKTVRSNILAKSFYNKEESYDAIRAMLANLDDPYTRFLDPKEFKEMRIDTTGELSGVGIQLSLDKETDQLVVISPIEGTPAFKAGVKPNDIIVSIDNKSTNGMSIQTAVKLIRGKPGTIVSLTLQRKNNLINFQLTRSRIEISSVNSHINQSSRGVNIGYIRLKQFNANAAKDMRNTLIEYEEKGVLGYVIDLRSNPGGLLEASVEISRQLLDKGIIVSTLTRDGIKDIRRAKGRAITKKPIVLLVNDGSASASEILAGAIKENNRGNLVGTKTFGKGLVQSVRALSDGSGLTVTIAKYLTPKGNDIHQNGIVPDVIAKLSNTEIAELSIETIGTYKDGQYKVAENLLTKLISKKQIIKSYNPYSSNLDFVMSF